MPFGSPFGLQTHTSDCSFSLLSPPRPFQELQEPQRGPKDPPRGHKMVPKRLPGGPKRLPGGPKTPQEDPQEAPKRLPRGPKRAPEAPKKPQERFGGPKWPPRGLEAWENAISQVGSHIRSTPDLAGTSSLLLLNPFKHSCLLSIYLCFLR